MGVNTITDQELAFVIGSGILLISSSIRGLNILLRWRNTPFLSKMLTFIVYIASVLQCIRCIDMHGHYHIFSFILCGILTDNVTSFICVACSLILLQFLTTSAKSFVRLAMSNPLLSQQLRYIRVLLFITNVITLLTSNVVGMLLFQFNYMYVKSIVFWCFGLQFFILALAIHFATDTLIGTTKRYLTLLLHPPSAGAALSSHHPSTSRFQNILSANSPSFSHHPQDPFQQPLLAAQVPRDESFIAPLPGTTSGQQPNVITIDFGDGMLTSMPLVVHPHQSTQQSLIQQPSPEQAHYASLVATANVAAPTHGIPSSSTTHHLNTTNHHLNGNTNNPREKKHQAIFAYNNILQSNPLYSDNAILFRDNGLYSGQHGIHDDYTRNKGQGQFGHHRDDIRVRPNKRSVSVSSQDNTTNHGSSAPQISHIPSHDEGNNTSASTKPSQLLNNSESNDQTRRNDRYGTVTVDGHGEEHDTFSSTKQASGLSRQIQHQIALSAHSPVAVSADGSEIHHSTPPQSLQRGAASIHSMHTLATMPSVSVHDTTHSSIYHIDSHAAAVMHRHQHTIVKVSLLFPSDQELALARQLPSASQELYHIWRETILKILCIKITTLALLISACLLLFFHALANITNDAPLVPSNIWWVSDLLSWIQLVGLGVILVLSSSHATTKDPFIRPPSIDDAIDVIFHVQEQQSPLSRDDIILSTSQHE